MYPRNLYHSKVILPPKKDTENSGDRHICAATLDLRKACGKLKKQSHYFQRQQVKGNHACVVKIDGLCLC
jgi:hypothetical protein